jgi:hypothetical protein
MTAMKTSEISASIANSKADGNQVRSGDMILDGSRKHPKPRRSEMEKASGRTSCCFSCGERSHPTMLFPLRA